MNKSIKIVMGLWLLCAGLPVLAQTTTPEASVAGLMAFTENPVDICSGIPDISIPLVSLPTRSKDISMNLAMAYHPKSKGQSPGLGWNVFAGGSITRRLNNWPDERDFKSGYHGEGDDIYEYNYMGENGMFYVKNDLLTGLQVSNMDNRGQSLKITIDFDAATKAINSFTIYDTQGYQYTFAAVDTVNGDFGTERDDYKETWHLSGIFDNNGKTLLSIGYTQVTQTFTAHAKPPLSGNVTEHNYFNVVESITSDGFGKIIFNYSTETVPGFTQSMKLTGFSMQDQFGNAVKKCNISSSQLDIMDPSSTIKETYLFEYKDTMSKMADDTDGYTYSQSLPVCASTAANYASTDPQLATIATLQKMTLPTGGCIIYDFESNLYNNYQLKDDDSDMLEMVPGDDQYFIRNYDDGTFIPENNIVTQIANQVFSGSSQQVILFNLTGAPETVYYQVTGPGYTPPGFGGTAYPTFTIESGASITWNGVTPQYPLSTLYVNYDHCLGTPYTLPPGASTVRIHMLGGATPNGVAIFQTLKRNPNPTRGFYGYGVRIRATAQFTDSAVDQHYFNDVAGYNALGYIPVKERSYNYDFFGQPKVSSGTTAGTQVENDYFEGIVYRNVTVTDLPSNGKTQYTFSSFADYEQAWFTFYDYRCGLPKKVEVFDLGGNTVKSQEMTYSFENDSYVVNAVPPRRMGWAGVTQQVTKEYFSGNPTPLATTETFGYFLHKPSLHTIINSAGETLKTVSTYNVLNSTLSKNRVAPSGSTSYRGTTQLSTSSIAYVNTFPGNVSYLPSTLSSGKGTETPTVRQRYNAYDEYGHVKESQTENGMKTAYIYGYNKSLLVAKIDNIAYASLPSTLVTNVQTVSNTNNNETALLAALAALRNDAALAGAMVTTYTYIPLVGVSTVTDPKGDVLKYTYDTFGRLVKVTDKQGNILSENAYHLKTQTP